LVNLTAATNTQFAIVVNYLSDPITGTFNGLPEGASVMAGDQVFQITYTGGTGNDVVLTKLADVFRPRLTIERASPASLRLLWPTSTPPFSLQSNTNLDGTNWIVATPPPTRTSCPRAAARACVRAASMPSVTNRNSVPPAIRMGARG